MKHDIGMISLYFSWISPEFIACINFISLSLFLPEHEYCNYLPSHIACSAIQMALEGLNFDVIEGLYNMTDALKIYPGDLQSCKCLMEYAVRLYTEQRNAALENDSNNNFEEEGDNFLEETKLIEMNKISGKTTPTDINDVTY